MYSKELLICGVSVAVTILAFLLEPCVASCPNASAVVPLDIDQLAGQWVMLAGSATSGNSISKCSRIAINGTSSGSFSLNFTALSRRSNKPVTFTANVTVGEEVVGFWRLHGSPKSLGPLMHRLLAADYDSYIVMIVCGNDRGILPNEQFALVLARDFSLSSRERNELKTKLHPYIASEKILDVDHTACQQ